MTAIERIKSDLNNRIAGWYRNARIDYGVSGRFLDAQEDRNDLRIVWEEDGKCYASTVSWWAEYTPEQIYNIWMEESEPEELPALTKENAKIGQYYAFAGGYTIVQRVYRISEEYARENGLCYLDRVATTIGDFALPGSDVLTSIRP